MRFHLLVAFIFLPGSALNLPAQELKAVATLKGHTTWVRTVALSEDGKLLAAGSEDKNGRLIVWELASGTELASFPGHRGGRDHGLAFSPDGKRLAVTKEDPSSRGSRDFVSVWGLAEQKEIVLGPLSEAAHTVAFSRDGRTLAAAGYREVKHFDLTAGKELASFQRLITAWHRLAFSSDLKTLAAPNYQEIDLWDLAAAKERLILGEHRGKVNTAAFSADDKLLAAASTYSDEKHRCVGQVKVWDAVTGRERATLKGEFDHVYALALPADGARLALLNVNFYDPDYPTEFRLLDVASSRVLLRHRGPKRSLLAVWITRDGRCLVAERLPDHAVRLWEAVPPRDGPR